MISFYDIYAIIKLAKNKKAGKKRKGNVMKITEEWILLQAPNASAVQNGRKLSQKGSFSDLHKTEDDVLYWADCAGSGKNPYHTSIDFTNEEAPTCRCSCPSRQFPCKHAIGLMFEILGEKTFTVADVPEDLAKKREKQAAKAEKKQEQATKPKKPNTAAQTKKIKKQLEGLDLAEKMVNDLLSNGLGTLAGVSQKVYEKLAKDLGSYYLTGVQTEFSRLASEINYIQHKKEDEVDYSDTIRILIRIHAMIQKSRAYLENKLETKQYGLEDTVLYEALGGIWKLEDLDSVGAVKENVELVQLAFEVIYDDARKEFIDKGYWLELDTGNIHQTNNYRPVKALKYVKQEDSCFDVLEIPKLYYYPGGYNRRVRWEGCKNREVDKHVYQTIRKFAQPDIPTAAKLFKNEIKNTLAEKRMAMLIPFSEIYRIEEDLVLEDGKGNNIVLRDMMWNNDKKLEWLPNKAWLENQVMFGVLRYDYADGRIYMQPYSIVTENEIIRLQY